MYFKIHGATDVGQCRNNNEDSFRYHLVDAEDWGVVALADGVGGYAGGEVASELVVNSFVNEVLQSDPTVDPSELIKRAFDFCNSQLLQAKSGAREFSRMGTTLVAAIAQHDNITVGNVGDSRCYKITPQGIAQITKDHSLFQELKDQGIEQNENDVPYKNCITRVMGSNKLYKVDVFSDRLKEGDRCLFCSDGLSNFLSEEEMTNILLSDKDIVDMVDQLISAANSHGGSDNITAVILECC